MLKQGGSAKESKALNSSGMLSSADKVGSNSGWAAMDENMLLKTKKLKEFGEAVDGDDESDDEGEEKEEEALREMESDDD